MKKVQLSAVSLVAVLALSMLSGCGRSGESSNESVTSTSTSSTTSTTTSPSTSTTAASLPPGSASGNGPKCGRSDSTWSWYDWAGSGARLAAVGAVSGQIVMSTSSDGGASWWCQFLPIVEDRKIQSVLISEDKYVAIGYNMIAFSVDGKAWTTQNVAGNFVSLEFNQGLYVAVGESSNGLMPIVYSKDGVTWARPQTSVGVFSPNPSCANGMSVVSQFLNDVTFANGVFVAVGGYQCPSTDTGLVALRSADGITWVRSTLPSVRVGWTSITAYKGTFFAGGKCYDYECLTSRHLKSIEGSLWATGALPASISVLDSNSRTIAGIWGGIRSSSYYEFHTVTSTDGVKWTVHQLDPNSGCGKLGFYDEMQRVNDQFWAWAKSLVHVHDDTRIMVSDDGITWTCRIWP